MFPFTHVSLIRYLIVWRINRSLVQIPSCLSLELSQVLGHLIARRLPTRTAREWRRAFGEQNPLESRDPARGRAAPGPSLSDLPTWPLETVLFVYPGKRVYGPGEPILWELKLLGEAADHGLFLEWILPAMEEAATTPAPSPYSLWGRFDIQAVYVARGRRWEPLVHQGKLDLKYQASPTQWRQGLTFGEEERRHFHLLDWITPFDLRIRPTPASPRRPARPSSSIPAEEIPSLQDILEALMARMTLFLPGKHHAPEEGWGWLDPEEQTALRLALQESREPPLQRPELKPAPKGWPGRWIGTQTFSSIPSRLLPYLELASILHIGKQTHFGCGTFRLDLFHRP